MEFFIIVNRLLLCQLCQIIYLLLRTACYKNVEKFSLIYSKSGLILIHVKFNVMNLDMNFKYNEINFNNEII